MFGGANHEATIVDRSVLLRLQQHPHAIGRRCVIFAETRGFMSDLADAFVPEDARAEPQPFARRFIKK